MKKTASSPRIAWLALFLVIPAFLHFPISPVFAQSSFTVFTNSPPSSGGIDAALVQQINAATTSIDLAVYSLDRQGIVNALFNAHSRGVAVRIVTETENYESDEYGPFYQQLEAAGITVVPDNSGGGGGGLCHDKFFVFEGAKVWTGSYNPTNSCTVANSNNAVLIDHSGLAAAYTAEFEEMFLAYDFGPQKTDNTAHDFTINGAQVESYFSPTDGAGFQIQSEIEAAEHSVYFLIFTFTGDAIGDALVSKYQEGVVVRGALDNGQKNVAGSEYQKLRDAGIPVRVDTYPGKLHHKVMIVDPGYENATVITGSCNWTASAFSGNDEDILILRHPGLAAQYYSLFEDVYQNHCVDEGGKAQGALAISEIMSRGLKEDILPGDRTNWAESQEGGSPGVAGEPDTLPPIIIHTPVERTLVGRPVYIHCEIYDPNDPEMYSAKEPTLYYRKQGESVFQSAALGAFFDEYNGTIPASEVTTNGVEYYLSARDWSYNLATSPSFSPQSHPYAIEAVDNPNAVIRFTEIMYDPPQNVEDESAYEWVEIFNTSAGSVDLSAWEFTDEEGTFAFPPGASIGGHEYQVLCKTASGPSGAFTRYIYGPDSIGNITLNNPLGVVTDQLILKDPTGLIVEEVDYSAGWGASNVKGPNDHTLEKIDPEGPNDAANWMYSMAEGGTPGAASSPHFVFHTYYLSTGYRTAPGIWINPTLINPGMDECTVYFRLNRDCGVTAKVYHPPDGTPPEHCYDSAYYLTTLLDAQPLAENMDPESPSHAVVWDGTYGGQTAIGNCRIVLWAADSSSQTSVCGSDDTMLTTLYHGFEPDSFNVFSHQPLALKFYQCKPAFITAVISKKTGAGQWAPIRTLIDNQAMPRPPDGVADNSFIWDGRQDNGPFAQAFQQLKAELEANDIFGNTVIARPPLCLYGVGHSPRSYFNPASSTPEIRTQKIDYQLSQGAMVTIKIADQSGGIVAVLVSNAWRNAGAHQETWDGEGNTGDGLYSYIIEAQNLGQNARFSGPLALYHF